MKASEDPLVASELARHDWSNLRDVSGRGTLVGNALAELIDAESPEAAENAYWRIENRAFVQGQLYESAVAVAHVLLAALVDDSRPAFVRGCLLELLFQCVAGESDESEVEAGRPDLGTQCRDVARLGLWLLYRDLLLSSTRESAHWILAKIEQEPSRLAAVELMLSADAGGIVPG